MASTQPRVMAAECGEYFPASPTSEYINSSVLSLSILSVFELEVPIDDSRAIASLKNEFLPISPRFSSILLRDGKGTQKWKRVEVKLEDHVHIPHFQTGLQPDAYDGYFREYLSKIAVEKLPENRPLWEAHFFKYPTREAESTIVFKLHHAIGDGFSLMGALFSGLKRADNPRLPLTFPSATAKYQTQRPNAVNRVYRAVSSALFGCWNTSSDFSTSVLHSTVLTDGRNAIRSGRPGLEFQPPSISTVTLPLNHIRQIKSKIRGTVNDVAVGTIFYAIQLYKQRTCQNPSNTSMTALVLMNTRMAKGYQSVDDMLMKKTWGNQFSFLHLSIPSSKVAEKADPLTFVLRAKKAIKRKKNSLAVFLTGRLLQALRSVKGPEAVSLYIYSMLKNSSTGISYLIGPVEKMEMAEHPVKSFYFTVVGAPQSLGVTMVSYMEKFRVVFTGERGFINSPLLCSCMKEAFDKTYAEACL